MIAVSIYSNIVARAMSKGISINALEETAELSKGSICKWNVVSPTVKSLKKVADILECTVDDLISSREVK